MNVERFETSPEIQQVNDADSIPVTNPMRKTPHFLFLGSHRKDTEPGAVGLRDGGTDVEAGLLPPRLRGAAAGATAGSRKKRGISIMGI